MNGIKGFDFRRFFLLIRNALFLNRSFILISSATIFVAGIFVSTMDSIGLSSSLWFYPVVLFVGGLIFAGNAFRELGDEARGVQFLTLPASLLEKLASGLILVTLFFGVWTIVLVALISFVSEGINFVFVGSTHEMFNPFSMENVEIVSYFIVVQSVFLLGGLYFKKHAIPKTILVVLAYTFLFRSALGIVGHALFDKIGVGYFFFDDIFNRLPELIGDESIRSIASSADLAIEMAFRCVLPVLFWLIAYLRLKETEV